MGVFTGAVVYTIFPGSRLIQQTARLSTDEPDTAYYFDAGLEFAAPDDATPGRNMRTPFAYYDTEGVLREPVANGLAPERVPYRVRYRTLATKAGAGSVAVFPAPHQYFFPRDFTSNLAHLWHRSRRGRVSLGIRQIRDTNWIFYPWVNAPPGTLQQMSVFFLLSKEKPRDVLDEALAFTNRDRFRPLDGYRTVSSHWHLAYTVQALASGFDWTPPFKPVLKDMGVDASIIMDYSWRRASARPHGATARRARRILQGLQGAVGGGLPADSIGRGERSPRRALGAGVSQAGLLVHEPPTRW